MPELQRHTVRLHYEDSGVGEPPLVFLHGWCDDSASWADTAAAFSARHRCLAPDMRGHGRSGQPHDHSYTPEALSGDVLAVCEAAGVRDPVLVGHSFGGFLAATIAMRYPGFARAVLVEDQPLDLRGFAGQMRELEAVIRSPEEHMTFRRQLFDSLISRAMPPAGRELVARAAEATPVEVGQALWAPLFEYTEAEMAARSDALMAALAGQPALSIEAQPTPEYHATLAHWAPKAALSVVDSGHWIHLERPVEFRAALREFLAAL